MSTAAFPATKRGRLIRACIDGTATDEMRDYYKAHLMEPEEVMFGKPVFEMSGEEFREYTILCENTKQGDLEGGDCPKCRNKGLIYGLDEKGNEYAEECTCMANRRAQQALAESEYGALLRRCTFTRYKLDHEWQRAAMARCKEWLRQRTYPFLFLGGKTGAGKTHLAVATFAERVRMGKHGTFVNWRTESEWLKFHKGEWEHEQRLNGLKRTPLLLLDDFLWQPKGALPTDEDLRLAKEIVDARLYNARPTILTGNYTLRELFSLNEELCGRIVEGSGGAQGFAIEFANTTQNIRFEELAADTGCPFGG